MSDANSTSTRRQATLLENEGRGWCRNIAAALAKDRRAQLLEVAFVFSPVLIAIAGLGAIRPDNPFAFMAALWLANLMTLGLIWAGIRIRGETCRSIGLSFSRPGSGNVLRAIWQSVAIAVAGIAAFVMGAVLMAILMGRPEPADLTQYNYLQGNLPMLLLSLAGVYAVSSFGEEVVYRGFLITRFESILGANSRTTAWYAVLTSSAIFGLAHFGWGPMGIVQTTCMGLVFGASFLLTKRMLWPLILAHAYMDTLLLLPLYFETGANV